MLANNETGVLQPLAEIAHAIARLNRSRHSPTDLHDAEPSGASERAIDVDAYVQRVFTQRPPPLTSALPHVYVHTDASQVSTYLYLESTHIKLYLFSLSFAFYEPI